jgi:hypothetical protein
MTSASLTAFPSERAMTQPPTFERTDTAPISALPPVQEPATLLGALALRLAAWRRRFKQARDFRGFDQRQLRDLGLNHFDQW